MENTPQATIGTAKPCCQQESNLQVIESRLDLTIRKCKVCGCRHFEATLQPGSFGVRAPG